MSSRLAVCLLSGGLDSSTCLALARRDGYECYALSFDYGQRHRIELDAAARVAAFFGAREHRTARIDLRAFGASALTADIDVPKHRSAAEMEHGIPVTYVPARNTIFLSYALAWAEVLEASDIFIGVNALDYSGYPDCRPKFIHAFEHSQLRRPRRGAHGSRSPRSLWRPPGLPRDRADQFTTRPAGSRRPFLRPMRLLVKRERIRGSGHRDTLVYTP
jgi:7-cyano-7-deazaguanine synthase